MPNKVSSLCELLPFTQSFNNNDFISYSYRLLQTNTDGHIMKFLAVLICGLVLLLCGTSALPYGGLFNRFNPEVFKNMED